MRSSVLSSPCGLHRSCWGALCFLYGVGVSPCGGAATLLQDPDQEGVSVKLLSQGRQRSRAQREEKPFPSLLATWAPGCQSLSHVSSSWDL